MYCPLTETYLPFNSDRFNASLTPRIYIDIDWISVYTDFLVGWMYSLIWCTLSVDVVFDQDDGSDRIEIINTAPTVHLTLRRAGTNLK